MQTTNVNKVLVSICIPVYNGANYLRECLDSCINQTFSDYEILICDDGSKDESSTIIEDYQKKYPAIRFYKNETNLGLVGNWNRCIELAKGEWIKFVFQDDYISTNCLSVFTNTIEDSSHLIVCERNFVLPKNADTDTITYYTKSVKTLENTGFYKGKYFTPKQLCTIAMKYMGMNFIGEPSLIFFRKDIVSKVGYFNKDLKQICDFEFAIRIGSNYGLTYIPEKLCFFRIHSQTTTSLNVLNNYFYLHYIEPLVFSYFLLFDSSFKSFRRNLGFFYSYKLRLYFKVKSFVAYEASKKQTNEITLFMNKETKFKEIEAVKTGSFFVRCLAKFLVN